jgi:hypothetical protein
VFNLNKIIKIDASSEVDRVFLCVCFFFYFFFFFNEEREKLSSVILILIKKERTNKPKKFCNTDEISGIFFFIFFLRFQIFCVCYFAANLVLENSKNYLKGSKCFEIKKKQQHPKIKKQNQSKSFHKRISLKTKKLTF